MGRKEKEILDIAELAAEEENSKTPLDQLAESIMHITGGNVKAFRGQ